jgi:hypothetical protein
MESWPVSPRCPSHSDRNPEYRSANGRLVPPSRCSWPDGLFERLEKLAKSDRHRSEESG